MNAEPLNEASDTRLRGRSRYGAEKARNLTPISGLGLGRRFHLVKNTIEHRHHEHGQHGPEG